MAEETTIRVTLEITAGRQTCWRMFEFGPIRPSAVSGLEPMNVCMAATSLALVMFGPAFLSDSTK